MGSNLQPPDHESDALTTVPRCPIDSREDEKERKKGREKMRTH